MGEHLFIGFTGRFFIYLSLVAGLFALLTYMKSVKASISGKQKYNHKARIYYFVQAISIIVTGIILLYLIWGHFFEYAYVFKHSSVLMPGRYIITCFWAGQEGSFLLWAILIAAFGFIALYRSHRLEGGVMAVVSLALIILMTMLLGADFAGIQIGSNPFILLRESEGFIGNAFFNNPSYLSLIHDGNGLNPLLDNFWMMIHPPVLFMGYAAALFPFAFAFASLLENNHRYWLKYALPWVILTIGLLGTGLVLGGAWAYQSLTFGGFWSWDPVENASLVPWLVLVAALHFMLLAYKRNKYYLGTYIFTFLSFIMVIYASYLTRSGVLGEASVHAFGDNGLSLQSAFFLIVFTGAPVWMLIKRWKNIPSSELPNLLNRESVMLYGAIAILLSAFQIISTTSIPVFGRIFNTKLALGADVSNFYNGWQMPFAMMITWLIGVAHYLTYNKNNLKEFCRNIIYPCGIALIIAIAGYLGDHDMRVVHALFLFCIVFCILSSFACLLKFTSVHRNVCAGITHLGFSVFLLGVLIAFSNIQVLHEPISGSPQRSNVMLFKGRVKEIGGQLLCYHSSFTKGDEVFYKVDFFNKSSSGDMLYTYSLYPAIKYNRRMGNVYKPDIRSSIKGDVFIYLTYAEDQTSRMSDGYSLTEARDFTLKDTLFTNGKTIVFDSLYMEMFNKQYEEMRITALMKTTDRTGRQVKMPLTYKITGDYAESGIITLDDQLVRLRFDSVSEHPKTIRISVYTKQPEFIVLKIMLFPWIWVLWAGAIIMFTGVTLAICKRIRNAR